MPDEPLPIPTEVAGIRNFAWVVPGLLARGEQPPLEASTFETLRDQGLHAVLSLRPDREPPTGTSAARWPEYIVEQERDLVEAAGMRFWHVPLEDFSPPTPDNIADALRVLDAQVAREPGVYVHCRAGAGRAAVVSGAWLIAHGGSGDRAAALYHAFMKDVWERREMTAEERHAMLVRVGQPQILWALHQIADALGSPVRQSFELLPPDRPEAADGWPRTFHQALQPWRERRD